MTIQLNQLEPGTEFHVPGLGLNGRLLMVNACRARVYLFDVGYDNWSPTAEVVLGTTAGTPPQQPTALPVQAIDPLGNLVPPAKRQRRRANYGGPTAKDIVYQLWRDFPGSTLDELYEEVEPAVKKTTIRSWIWHWGRGQHLPASVTQENELPNKNSIANEQESGTIELGKEVVVSSGASPKERVMATDVETAEKAVEDEKAVEKLQVDREKAIALIDYCGWKKASKWGNDRLAQKLVNVKDVTPDEEPAGDVKATLEAVVAAIDNNVEIEVVGGAAPEKAAKKAKGEKGEKKSRARGGSVSSLDAAEQVLTETKVGMTSGALCKAMTEKGLWTSPSSKNPSAGVNGAIWTDMKKNGENSRFVKVGRGLYGLRDLTYEVAAE
jgi:hypothetical protein